MKLLLSLLTVIILSGCGEDVDHDEESVEVNYFCFFGSVYKVESLEDDHNSSIVIDYESSTALSCNVSDGYRWSE